MTKRIERHFAGRTLSLEIGHMARLAAGSCLVQYGETAVLCAATVQDNATHLPFFPLTVGVPREELRRRKDSGRLLQTGGSPR